MAEMVSAIIGVTIGAAIVLMIWMVRSRREQQLARTILQEAQTQKAEELGAIVEQLKTAFAALSRDALTRNTDDFLKLAKTKLDHQAESSLKHLDTKKELIDAGLKNMSGKLTELTTLIQSVDKERRESAGAIKSDLQQTADATHKLRETTAQLREALANPQRRGQWGERIAEDVLRLAGFVEGVNYEKQQVVASGEKPDYTFVLPKGLRVNMDVKFSLDNYLRAVEAPDEASAKRFEIAFLRDVRDQIKSVTSREYIDPEGGTVDYVLVFIPNEQIYGYLHEHDPTLLDDAIKQKVVLCSPLTLYAVLSVIRQSVESFRLEQTANEILGLLGAFQREWVKYCDVAEKMGKALEQAMKQFEALQGTRTRRLERQLDRIEDLRQAKGIALPMDQPVERVG